MKMILALALGLILLAAPAARADEIKLWQYTPGTVRCDGSVGTALMPNPTAAAIRIRQVEIIFVGADRATGETAAWLIRSDYSAQVYSFGAEVLTPVSGQPLRGHANFSPDYVTVAAGESLLFLWQCIPFTEVRAWIPVVNIYWIR